jgi:hypothetical protein
MRASLLARAQVALLWQLRCCTFSAQVVHGFCVLGLKTRLKWVHWFNHHRLLESIGYIPPAEAEANYDEQLNGHAATAA